MTRQNFADKCFKDKNGKVVLWQSPNAFLVIWFIATVFSHVTHGSWLDVARAGATIAIIIWAIGEVFWGVNYFRRAGGLVVLAVILIGRL